MHSQSPSCRYYMIGQQLKSARHKSNLHPSVVAKVLGSNDPEIVFSIEAGNLKVPLDALPQLALALKLPLYQLQAIVEGYYPGFSSKAREIVEMKIPSCPEAKYAVAIVLSAIAKKVHVGGGNVLLS